MGAIAKRVLLSGEGDIVVYCQMNALVIGSLKSGLLFEEVAHSHGFDLSGYTVCSHQKRIGRAHV